jgi:hypothetical protein
VISNKNYFFKYFFAAQNVPNGKNAATNKINALLKAHFSFIKKSKIYPQNSKKNNP